jgi:hypothetical protein
METGFKMAQGAGAHPGSPMRSTQLKWGLRYAGNSQRLSYVSTTSLTITWSNRRLRMNTKRWLYMRPSGDDDIGLMISRIYYDERCPKEFHSCRPRWHCRRGLIGPTLSQSTVYHVPRLFAARCKDALRLGNDALDSYSASLVRLWPLA